ncbi:hypothetical protein KC220_22170, partial [Mycobacterium tuberculosis]|nr:hypothetical protein [Mycobacterium tuberculosis]
VVVHGGKLEERLDETGRHLDEMISARSLDFRESLTQTVEIVSDELTRRTSDFAGRVGNAGAEVARLVTSQGDLISERLMTVSGAFLTTSSTRASD